MTARVSKIIGSLIFALLVTGCAPTINQPYVRPDRIPEGKAIVYIYRPSLILGLSSIDIKANGTVVNTMYSGTYYPYVTDPGLIEFSAKTETTDMISLYAKPGQTYFLKMGFKQGILIFRPHLMIVPEPEAEQEITEFNYKLLREPVK